MKKSLFAVFWFLISSLTFASINIPIVKNIGPLIVININDQKSDHYFLIDTGSNANFLSEDFIQNISSVKDNPTFNLKRSEKDDQSINTFNNKIKSEAYSLDITLNGLKIKNQSSFKMNTARFSKSNDGIDCCEGILGAPFLKDHPFKIDVNKKVLTLNPAIKKKDYSIYPFKIEGKNVITINCESPDKANFKARLDTGNEAPLILMPPFLERNFAKEKLTLLNQQQKLNVFDFDLMCGKLSLSKFSAIMLPHYGGALAHNEVDGNLGGHFLGDQYFIDYKKKILGIHHQSKPFDAQLKSKPTSIDWSNHQSIYPFYAQFLKLDFLTVKSCAENSPDKDVSDCLKERANIEGREFSFKEIKSNDLIDKILPYYYDPILLEAGCSPSALIKELVNNPTTHSYCWWLLGRVRPYKDHHESLEFKTKLSIDNKIALNTFSNPIVFSGLTYCYYIKEKVISYEKLDPFMFAFSVEGISLSRKGWVDYKNWLLNTNEGQACKNQLTKLIGLNEASNLLSSDSFFQDKDYILIANLYAILANGPNNKFKEKIQSILNHERLHTIYSESEAVKAETKRKWASLSPQEQKDFKDKHPSYNFLNPGTLLKEYFSYSCQDDLDNCEAIFHFN